MVSATGVVDLARGNACETDARTFLAPDRPVAIPNSLRCASEGLARGDDSSGKQEREHLAFLQAATHASNACMLIFDAIAAFTGAVLIWMGLSSRLTTFVTNLKTGERHATGVGNALAVGAGICVMVSAIA